MKVIRNMAVMVLAGAFLALSMPVMAGGADGSTALPDMPDGKWLSENPYRGSKLAIEKGKSAYNNNCARCHGIRMISGGLAPDLRELGPQWDEYFIGHIRNGVQRNGVTYMPGFEGVLDQKTMWEIRSYIDKRHYDLKDKNLDDLYKQWDGKQPAGDVSESSDAAAGKDSTSANKKSTDAKAAAGSTVSSKASDDSEPTAAADGLTEDSDRLAHIKAVGSIEIAMYRNFPPWSYQSDDGRFEGIDVEIGKALASKLGVSLNVEPFRADEGMGDDIRNHVWKGHYLMGKPSDAMIHVGMAPAFQKDNDQATFIAPYYNETMGFAYDASRLGGKIDGPLALVDEKIGVKLDSLGDFFLTSAYQGRLRNGIVHFDSVPEAMQGMKEGKVAAVMAPIGEISGAAKMLGDTKLNINTFKVSGIYQTKWDVGIAIKAGNPELAAAITKATQSLRDSGKIQEIFTKFGVPYRKPTQNDKFTADS